MEKEFTSEWRKQVIVRKEIDKYLVGGKDFINESEIFDRLSKNTNPEPAQIRDILQKSLFHQDIDTG